MNSMTGGAGHPSFFIDHKLVEDHHLAQLLPKMRPESAEAGTEVCYNTEGGDSQTPGITALCSLQKGES